MADQDGKAKLVSKLSLQFEFPKPEATAVTPTGVAEDQYLVLSLEARALRVCPPLGNRMDGKF